MSAIRWCAVAALACGALAACDALLGKELNPKFCAAQPDDSQCRGDASQRCSSTEQCAAPLVCDVMDTQSCVACTQQEAAACTGATPVCGDDHACRGCVSHAECPASKVCLPDGACADAGQVAYVEPAPGGTDNPSCTFAMPCTKLANALQTGRPYVKVAGSNDEGSTITIDNRNVTLLAEPGAKLTRTTIGLLVEVRGTSEVAIYDLEISGALGAQGVGISIPLGGTPKLTLTRVKVLNNTGGGISASGGTLTVSQSTISNNAGGGISVNGGTFVIVGNVFVNNGSDMTLVGALGIGTPQNAMNRLEFNSFTRNKAQDTIGTAIQCIAGVFTARNNIMSGNGTMTNSEQVGGTCTHAFSIVRPGTLPPGAGNSSADPLFVNPVTGDLHVRTGSPALGAADPSSNLEGPAARDIDGDARIAPADLGADEVP